MATTQRLSDDAEPATTATGSVSIAICARSPVLREGIAAAFCNDPRFSVVATFGESSELLANLPRISCKVVVLVSDTQTPDVAILLNGLQQQQSTGRLLLIVAQDAPQDVAAILRLGVRGLGFLSHLDLDDLRQAVLAMASTGIWVCNFTLSQLVQLASNTPPLTADADFNGHFSQQELGVLRLIGDGRSEAEIVAELCLARSTVRTYLTRIRRKLHAHSRADTIETARRYGLLPDRRNEPRPGGDQSKGAA